MLDDYTGFQCGYEAADTIKLPASSSCWTVTGVEDCLPSDQSPCQGPQRPIWKPGTELTLWCPIGDVLNKDAVRPEEVACE